MSRRSEFHNVKDGRFHIEHTEDVEPLLDSLKEERSHNAGSHRRSAARWRKVAELPMVVIEKWLREDGFNALAPGNEDETLRRVKRDYPYLLAVDKV